MAFKRSAVRTRLSPLLKLFIQGVKTMLSMSKLRDNSKVFMGVLLFFFVLSMTVGGLVGGANIITTIQGFFGKINTNLYVGKIGDSEISIQKYQLELRNELNRLARQGRTDSRSQMSAMNTAWNNIVDETITSKKIKELNLSVSDEEVIDFLINEPPPDFTNSLIELKLYTNEDGSFNLDAYQTDAKKRALPTITNELVQNWLSPGIKDWIAERKLRTLMNNSASVSEYEIISDYKKSLSCEVDLLSINFNNIDNDKIEISEEELLDIYKKDRDEKYFNEKSISVEYVLWENIIDSELPDSIIVEKQDSILQDAIDFASEAEITSFQNALESFNLSVKDTLLIKEEFNSNSPIGRSGVRFSFDNPIGTSSNYITTENGIMILHIIDVNESNYTAFEDVKDKIKNSLTREKKKEFALSELNNIQSSNDSWVEIAEKYEYIEYTNNAESTLGGTFKPIGRSNELSGALFNLNTGKISEVLSTSNYLFLAEVKTIENFSESDYESKKDSINTSILKRKRNSVYYNWLNEEKKKLEITDLRHKIF